MAARILDFHPEATNEIESAVDWYLQRSPDAADGFVAALNKTLSDVLADPGRFSTHLKNTRYAMLHGYPYLVVFRLIGATVRVFSVPHTSRRPGYWAKRLRDSGSN